MISEDTMETKEAPLILFNKITPLALIYILQLTHHLTNPSKDSAH